ncbi:hypothetical protein [Enterococcus malodoratus]|uniref:hypothetical protein n=1 Tax=Enterococcus malodoratus TaxID=71451 RepID=UPI0039AECB2C
MALTHEFGIIPELTEISYEEHAPKKYHCISPALFLIKTYFDSFDRPEYGLAYYGTTIIPPESLSSFLDIVLSAKNLKKYEDIIALSKIIIQAKRENKYMIHYGI